MSEVESVANAKDAARSDKATFDPRILVFTCNWCSYAGADLAGTSRLQYPPNARIIRTMCSGRIEPVFVLEALRDGADGVIVTGCHPGDCHYVKGNFRAEKRFNFLKMALKLIGVEEDRVRLAWISAGEGEKFSLLIRDMTDKIRELGPNPFKSSNIKAI
jgi:F420-non-reducing hydrogenase iron-sulfur subunit